MSRASLLAICLFSLSATPAWAETVADAEAPADDIVVTAARTELPASALPLTIDVIDTGSLAQQVVIGGSVVDAVANLTPSFSPTRGKLSGAGETLRGRSPLYAINGIPQSTPLRDGSRDGFTIDPFFVDRVELIYGSNALQGIGATGGIVNQVTVGAPREEGISGRAMVQGTADTDFSGDGFGGRLAGLVQWRGGAFDASFGAAIERRGAYYDARGNRIGINLTQGETLDSLSWSLFTRLGWQIGDSTRLDLIVSRFELEGDGDYVAVPGNRLTGVPTSSRRGNPPGEPASNRTESVALTLTDDDLWGGNFAAQLFFNRSRDTFGGELAPIATFQDPLIAPVGTLFDQSQNRSRKLGARASYERAVPGLEALTLTLGFDALRDETEQRLIATGRSWVPPTRFTSLAPFVQGNLALFDGLLRLAGGARWENVEIAIDDFTTLATSGRTFVAGGSPRFDDVLVNGGIIVEPMEGLRLYASYAEGFTVPDVGRIMRAISTPGLDIDNFLDIDPVVSNNREIGIEFDRGPLDASATYFWSSSDRGQLLIAQPGNIFTVQRQRVEIEGLELNIGVNLPLPGLRVSAGYSHILGRFDSNNPVDGIVDTDLDGTNISPDRLLAAVQYEGSGVTARVQTNWYLARTFTGRIRDPRNDFGGYAITDASVRAELPVGALTLAASNLFNVFAIDYNSDTRLPTDNLAFFAIRGRTLTLSWDWRF